MRDVAVPSDGSCALLPTVRIRSVSPILHARVPHMRILSTRGAAYFNLLQKHVR